MSEKHRITQEFKETHKTIFKLVRKPIFKDCERHLERLMSHNKFYVRVTLFVQIIKD